MNLMLQLVSKDKGTAARLRGHYGFKEEIACKTGTTQSNSDGWFIGSTSQLLTTVWVGATILLSVLLLLDLDRVPILHYLCSGPSFIKKQLAYQNISLHHSLKQTAC